MKDRFLHPFLLTAFPVFSLFVHNLLPLRSLPVLVLPLLVSLLGVWLVFYVLKKLLRHQHKAAVITTLLSVFFFSYGHLYEFMLSTFPGFPLMYPFAKNIIPLVVGFVLLGLGVFWALLTRSDLRAVNGFLNVMSVIALAQPVIGFAMEQANEYKVSRQYNTQADTGSAAVSNKNYPNIYCIMMDGYAREDVLKEQYDYDNSPFISYLRSKGFYVADCSQSNYSQTVFSQAATLNMQYVDELAVIKDDRSEKSASLAIFHNEVFKFLRKLGYKTVSFDAAIYDHVQVTNTDVYYRTPTLSGFAFDNFHYQFISLTPVQLLLKYLENDQSRYNELQRQKILHGFRKLKDAQSLRSPVFVYGHFLAPHTPHVFGPNGEPLNPKIRNLDQTPITDIVTRNTYRKTYRDELHYLNSLLKETIDTILAQSATPPIIILQSDHGPDASMDVNSMERSDMKERLSNLFAVYLPCESKEQLYQTVTPVNAFRIVFNSCFNTRYPLLPDRSYFSTHEQKLDFKQVNTFGCTSTDSAIAKDQ